MRGSFSASEHDSPGKTWLSTAPRPRGNKTNTRIGHARPPSAQEQIPKSTTLIYKQRCASSSTSEGEVAVLNYFRLHNRRHIVIIALLLLLFTVESSHLTTRKLARIAILAGIKWQNGGARERKKREKMRNTRPSGAELKMPLGKGRLAFNHAIEVRTRLINTVLTAIFVDTLLVHLFPVLLNVTLTLHNVSLYIQPTSSLSHKVYPPFPFRGFVT